MNPHTNQGHTSYFSAESASPCYGVGVKTEYISTSSGQTKKIARNLAMSLAHSLGTNLPKKQALIIALSGELGSGKTTFLQGFAKGLGIKDKILSPTFIIMKKFQIPRLHQSCLPARQGLDGQAKSKFQNFYHIDCYRIQKPKELLVLGFKEIISNSKNIVSIEWADKIKKILPKNTVWINFKFISEKKRKITMINGV